MNLINYIQDRNSICHTEYMNIRSKTNQQEFIQTLQNTNFDDDLKPVALTMLKQLEGVTLKKLQVIA